MAKFLEKELAEKTKYKTIKKSYQKNNLTVVLNDNVWWIEKCNGNKLFDLVCKEMKRLFPKYTYIYELQ